MLETRIDTLDLSVLKDCQLPVRLAYVPGLLAFREVTVRSAHRTCPWATGASNPCARESVPRQRL